MERGADRRSDRRNATLDDPGGLGPFSCGAHGTSCSVNREAGEKSIRPSALGEKLKS
jgi:hypothetical protein